MPSEVSSYMCSYPVSSGTFQWPLAMLIVKAGSHPVPAAFAADLENLLRTAASNLDINSAPTLGPVQLLEDNLARKYAF